MEMDTVPKIIETLCTECGQGGVNPDTLEHVLLLAIEIAREGREGRKIGTLFVVGDSENVLRKSRPMILDPLFGHPEDRKRIDDPDLRETVKELAQLDGGFVVSDDGVVISAGRYINSNSENVDLPLGLGTRHMAGASITRETGALAVVVSESSTVRLFDDGKVLAEILPEMWMFQRYASAARDQSRVDVQSEAGLTVVREPTEPT